MAENGYQVLQGLINQEYSTLYQDTVDAYARGLTRTDVEVLGARVDHLRAGLSSVRDYLSFFNIVTMPPEWV